MFKPFEPYLLIAIGGFAGACARYALNEVLPGMYGILLINVAGCYLLGVLMYESMYVGAFTPQTRMTYGIGFVGAFTTFSTFSMQSFQASPVIAALNIATSLVLGIAAVFLGRLTVAISGGAS